MSKRKFLFPIFIVFSVTLLFGCGDNSGDVVSTGTMGSTVTSETEGESEAPVSERVLPAPKNFSLRFSNSSSCCYYTFTFSPVEYAKSYLVYHSETNNINTAKPFVAGEFSPLTYTLYYNTDSISGLKYFWVRAYDGKNYGEWSEVVARNAE